jgi:hypothetical protein
LSTASTGSNFNRNCGTWGNRKVAAFESSATTATTSNVRTATTAATDNQNIKSGYASRHYPVTTSGVSKFFDCEVSGFVLVRVTTIVQSKWNVI